ncbi:MAG TPA: hypothetical protein VIQ54_11395 [Polyangia bacterium]
MSKQRLLKGVALAVLGAAVGCTDLPSTEPTPDDTGRVEFALVMVPTDVQCITITATGSRVRQQDFIVVPAQTSVLAMNGLPVGAVTFSGQAFNGPCGGGGPMGPSPTYVADPVTAQINATGVTSLALNMRRNGQASISVDFETGGMCGVAGAACSPTSPNACCTGLSCVADPTTMLASCQPSTMCMPPGAQCGPGTSMQCCPGLACQGDATGLVTCQPPTCAPQGIQCSAATVCCAGLTCQGDATGLLSCQPQNMCVPSGGQCAGASPCCAGLVCQSGPGGVPTCLPPVACRPPGAPCGPGMTQQCCAGLMCVVDPAAQTAICQ